tara:strand:+ start:1464 stop:1955 length:492 start_codon:yes stop_codon:yes gene_type:complete
MIRSIHIALLFFIGSLTFLSCKEEGKHAIKKEEIVFKKEGTLAVFKPNSALPVTTFDIEIAESAYETETGLMYRKGMEEQQGMLFISPIVRIHNFYMKNTAFALDLVFIKEDLTIGSFQENAKPFDESTLSSQVPVKYVLELNAGLVQKLGLEVGDRITFERQ